MGRYSEFRYGSGIKYGYPDASQSSQGSGGSVHIKPELWTGNIAGFPLNDISDYLIDFSIDMNVDRQIMLILTVRIRNPADVVTPYVEYFIPYLTIGYEDGRDSERIQLGVYPIRIPGSGEFSTRLAVGTFTCDDLVSVPANYFAQTTRIYAPASTTIVSQILGRLAMTGIIKKSLPDSAQTFGTTMERPIGTNYLDWMNEQLVAMGWYTLHMKLDGTITSAGPYVDLSDIEPAMTLIDTDLMSTIVPTNNDSQICNIALVVNGDNASAPLVGTYTNSDASSPTSTVKIGPRMKKEIATGATTQSSLNRRARQIVREGRSYYRTIALSILPQPLLLNPRQVIRLDLTGEQQDFSGLWYVRTARMGCTPDSALMTLELNQTVRFDGSAV